MCVLISYVSKEYISKGQALIVKFSLLVEVKTIQARTFTFQ